MQEGRFFSCSKTGDCVAIPAAHVMTVRLGYDGSLDRRVKRDGQVAERWIAEVMTHAQALLRHPSLPTEITLKVRTVQGFRVK